MKLLMGLLLMAHITLGQNTPMHFDDENFAYKVKQVDEFIERFNNTNETLIKDYLKDRYQLEVSREQLVISLFDASNPGWNREQVSQFLEDVVHQKEPPYLSFYDQDWYAKVICEGVYKEEKVNFTLVLSIKNNAHKDAVNWGINSMEATFMGLSGDVDSDIVLPPNSHGTDFLELKHIFSAPQDYMGQAGDKSSPINKLLKSMAKRELAFKQVKKVSYHFMQLDHWIFKVEEFDRMEKNNGWLISELLPAGTAEKAKYLKSQLFISLAK